MILKKLVQHVSVSSSHPSYKINNNPSITVYSKINLNLSIIYYKNMELNKVFLDF